MWLFGVFEFLGLIVVLGAIFAYCKIRGHGFWRFIWQHLKWVSLAVLVVWVVIAIVCRHHIYDATQCYFRGVSMKTNTKYSIYLSECQVQTGSGAYVPIDRTRALPDGKLGDEHDGDYYSY